MAQPKSWRICDSGMSPRIGGFVTFKNSLLAYLCLIPVLIANCETKKGKENPENTVKLKFYALALSNMQENPLRFLFQKSIMDMAK
jgi:hypothetical protein